MFHKLVQDRMFGSASTKRERGTESSQLDFPEIIDRKIETELSKQRILGPYNTPPKLPKFCISPLGVVPKKAACEYRMIHHLSYP